MDPFYLTNICYVSICFLNKDVQIRRWRLYQGLLKAVDVTTMAFYYILFTDKRI